MRGGGGWCEWGPGVQGEGGAGVQGEGGLVSRVMGGLGLIDVCFRELMNF